MSDPRPIGVFDSGVGGLTVARAIMEELPRESVVYFADTARYPYGSRPLEEIRGFAVEIATHLVDRDVKLIQVGGTAQMVAAISRGLIHFRAV